MAQGVKSTSTPFVKAYSKNEQYSAPCPAIGFSILLFLACDAWFTHSMVLSGCSPSASNNRRCSIPRLL